MGRPLTVSRAGRFSKRMNFVEELRAALPVTQYIAMLHEGALTGRLPLFDRHGNRLPDTEQPKEKLEEEDRARLIQYLVDKSMPTYRQVEAPDATAGDTSDIARDAADADFSLLSSDQLRALAASASELAEHADDPHDPGTSEARSRARLASPDSVPGPSPS